MEAYGAAKLTIFRETPICLQSERNQVTDTTDSIYTNLPTIRGNQPIYDDWSQDRWGTERSQDSRAVQRAHTFFQAVAPSQCVKGKTQQTECLKYHFTKYKL